MKITLTLLFILVLSLEASVKDSIVKIYTISKIPNYSIPWNSSIKRSHGSGSIVMGDRILTNAHVVANETFIEVKRYGQNKRYEAEVEFISHQADLALLRVKDETFFKGTKSLELDGLPAVQQEISVYGFPMGGNSLSVSTGIVSRIEHNRYAHSREILLSIQIDAAVNPGNSGGPAISDGKIVGVVMQQISKSQNIGYLVPSEVIKHFFEDIADGEYDGFANLGFGTQKMENETLREIYGLKKDVTGVMAMDISEHSSVYKILKGSDILLEIDGHTIQNDGTVEFIPEQFTSFTYYVDKKHIGESVEFKILRDTKVMSVRVPLSNIADDDLLVDTLEHDVMPRYFIYGGYVFSPLSRNLLANSRSRTLNEVASKWATKDREEVVVLLKVLADKSNRGDHRFSLWMIDKLDGETFVNFSDFKKRVLNSKGPYILLENEQGIKVAIDKKQAKEIESSILKRYSIKSSTNEN
ncbi:MAG: trypsin-like peptidase domain-containing protein [Campylobacterota bacterium]|nr:trypsin-like peptidase domain-containing protein [Campylobacterota bacterium]